MTLDILRQGNRLAIHISELFAGIPELRSTPCRSVQYEPGLVLHGRLDKCAKRQLSPSSRWHIPPQPTRADIQPETHSRGLRPDQIVSGRRTFPPVCHAPRRDHKLSGAKKASPNYGRYPRSNISSSSSVMRRIPGPTPCCELAAPKQRSCVNAGTLERAVRRVSGGQPRLLSPLRRFAVCRMADGSIVTFDRLDLLELSGAPRGPYVPNTRKGSA